MVLYKDLVSIKETKESLVDGNFDDFTKDVFCRNCKTNKTAIQSRNDYRKSSIKPPGAYLILGLKKGGGGGY